MGMNMHSWQTQMAIKKKQKGLICLLWGIGSFAFRRGKQRHMHPTKFKTPWGKSGSSGREKTESDK